MPYNQERHVVEEFEPEMDEDGGPTHRLENKSFTKNGQRR